MKITMSIAVLLAVSMAVSSYAGDAAVVATQPAQVKKVVLSKDKTEKTALPDTIRPAHKSSAKGEYAGKVYSLTMYFEPYGDAEGVNIITTGPEIFYQAQYTVPALQAQIELKATISPAEQQGKPILLRYSLVDNEQPAATGKQDNTVLHSSILLEQGEKTLIYSGTGHKFWLKITQVK